MATLYPRYLGVLSPFDLRHRSLKRDAIFFDQIAIPNIVDALQDVHDLPDRMHDKRGLSLYDLKYLYEQGVIVDPVESYIGEEQYRKRLGVDRFERYHAHLKGYANQLKEEVAASTLAPGVGSFTLNDLIVGNSNVRLFIERIMLNVRWSVAQVMPALAGLSQVLKQYDYDQRQLAIDLRNEHQINAFPVYPSNLAFRNEFETGKSKVIGLVVPALPIPDPNRVPWEQIIEFRSDPDSMAKLNALRVWVNRIARQDLTDVEIAEELRYAIDQYENHLRVHRMEYKKGVIETVLTVAAELLEGMSRLKPTQVVKGLYSIQHHNIQMNKAEIKIPHQEIAYIIKARQKLG